MVPFSKIIAEVCIGISPLKGRGLLAKLRLESPQLMEVMVPETGSLRAQRVWMRDDLPRLWEPLPGRHVSNLDDEMNAACNIIFVHWWPS